MKRRKAIKCDYPGCTSTEARRIDIETNWFRGDDVVLNVCKEHGKKTHHTELLKTDKAKRQMA